MPSVSIGILTSEVYYSTTINRNNNIIQYNNTIRPAPGEMLYVMITIINILVALTAVISDNATENRRMSSSAKLFRAFARSQTENSMFLFVTIVIQIFYCLHHLITMMIIKIMFIQWWT